MIYTNSKIKQSNGPGVTPEIIFIISRERSRTGRGGNTLDPEGHPPGLSPSHKTESRGDPTLKKPAVQRHHQLQERDEAPCYCCGRRQDRHVTRGPKLTGDR